MTVRIFRVEVPAENAGKTPSLESGPVEPGQVDRGKRQGRIHTGAGTRMAADGREQDAFGLKEFVNVKAIYMP